ncbi:hypothetical protein SDRG_16679 [Saprolegnia diclina VS20]|uniref:Uncharacterized protein n=1 Tax=Saprolegnia diclina (strain VS20) TaxID=1156394 RepID=T0PWT0_SAPDV|nr:hypothetical protein SDRG_16679 [Saprolegnia diclina VS20]EQC25460.1 hypothetical protein SDRG_16679 [Saprolegnia diclina VS20]|eukprot:XP_008621119.1 hypothetical protein SDRG_16679 [Saprolegnia diclina VS20]
MEKHVVGLPCETHCGGYNKRRRYGRYEDYDDGADDGESAEMDEIHDETLRVLHWVNERNEQLKLASVQIQLESELVNNVDDVFEDMEPTQREYEGYTGNAGPTLEFTYRRALLVLWPRARSLEVAGVKSALSRVQSLVDSGDAASAESLLERIAAFAVAPTEPELATALQAAATIAARESAVAMLRRWAATPKAPVPSRSSYYDKQTPTDSTTTLVPAIAALIHSFGWTSSFKELISTTVAPRLGLAAVVQLAGAAPQAADTLLSTVNWTTTTLPLPSLSALHDLDANGRLPDRVFMQLVAKSDLSYGDMSTLVRRAIGQESPSSVFLAIALAQRPPDKTHTVPIATTLLSVPAAAALFVQSLLGPCQHASDSIVPGILETARQLSNTPAYQNLVSFRLRLLPGAKDAPPVKTWCQPSARLPSHPRVQDFLRGPTQTMTEVGFNGIAHARNFANKYFGAGVNRVTGASAMAEPYGTGQNARCDITKTDSYYKASLVKWKQRRDEGIALRQLLSAPFERVTVSIGADV